MNTSYVSNLNLTIRKSAMIEKTPQDTNNAVRRIPRADSTARGDMKPKRGRQSRKLTAQNAAKAIRGQERKN